jgi:hypothetical protein
MSTAGASAIAFHVETAKRLLDELEQHAELALETLGAEDGSEFLAAIAERDRILVELNDVVEALAHERVGAAPESPSQEEAKLLSDMARAAAAALHSHEHLLSRTQTERDRLAAALARTNRPDSIAHQYAVATNVPRPRTLSVTG